ncbi:MAG: hypothetical protein ABIH23_35305 [bacterium]
MATDFGNKIEKIIPLTYLNTAGTHCSVLIVIADGYLYIVNGTTISTLNAELVLGDDTFQIDGEDLVFPSMLGSDVEQPISITENITIGGEELVFTATDSGIHSMAQRLGKLYLAGDTLQVYDPVTGVIADVDGAPEDETLVCVYRDRIILGGQNHLFYASRVSDPTDFDFGGDFNDVTRAVVGQLSEAGRIGESLTAIIPFRDQELVFASANELWVLHGDPATGTIRKISGEIGVIAQDAWCITDAGLIAFLSSDGLYFWGVGSGYPIRFSEELVPMELRELDPALYEIGMSWDAKARGIWLFATPLNGRAGKHWFMDMTQKAIWEMRFSMNSHQPKSVARYNAGSGINDVVLGCRDGYLRTFSSTATTDDGTAMQSHVVFGAFRLSAETRDGILNEIHGIMADNAGSVTWRAFTGPTAETVVDAASAAITALLAGSAPSSVKASGSWEELYNRVSRPRARGAWCAILLSSTERWAFESMTLVSTMLGRQRQ